MRVWVRFDGRGYEVEAEHADGSSSVRYCSNRADAVAYVAQLRKEGNRKECQF
jgi:hypothetical protein